MLKKVLRLARTAGIEAIVYPLSGAKSRAVALTSEGPRKAIALWSIRGREIRAVRTIAFASYARSHAKN